MRLGGVQRCVRTLALLTVGVIASCAAAGASGEEKINIPEAPGPVPAGFWREATVVHIVETDVSPEYTKKVAGMVARAEKRFFELFKQKLHPDMMKGTFKGNYDKSGIPGDILRRWRFLPWIELRVFKTGEKFAEEWFDLTDIKDKRQRLTTGLPGAYFSIGPDYDKKFTIRRIRSFVDNRDDDEVERTLLHEMGHLFMWSYILSIGGDPPKGQESQKRGTPAWMGEGVAQLFENLWSNAASAKKEMNREQAMIYEANKVGDSYLFKDFIEVTNAHNLAAVAGDPLKATINYAQSASVMDYFVNVDGARFFSFLDNLRQLNFERNFRSKDPNHIHELYSFQNEAFKRAFTVDINEVEKYWKDHVKKEFEKKLKSNPELHYWIGEYYLRRRKDKTTDPVNAEINFKIAYDKAPTKGEGYLGLGRMALRKPDYEAALKLLTKAVELMPNDDDALYYCGVAQVNSGQIKDAVATFEKLVKIFPRNYRALEGLGDCAFYLNDYTKASDAYYNAYSASTPKNPFYLFQQGRAAFYAKKYADAQRGFNTYTEWYPNHPWGQFWYGMAAWRIAKTPEEKKFALEKLELAAKLAPGEQGIKVGLEMAKRGETMRFEGEPPEVVAGKTPEKKEPEKEKKKPVIDAGDE